MNKGAIIFLRGRETEPAGAELLALAQIHRSPAEATARGPKIAAEYATSVQLQLFGYQVDGRILGVAGVEPAGSRTILRDLAVAPESRRQGIGRALIEHVREHFDALEGDTLEPAVDFYRACGFDVSADGVMPDGRTRFHFNWSRGMSNSLRA